jgi:cyclohexa-1,5-dienecarbonyl-CoA hydratase
MSGEPLVRSDNGGNGWVRLFFDRPPANVLTMAMCNALQSALADAAVRPETKLISIEGAGANFSYGASVEEHAPDRVREMLPAFHRLIGAMLDTTCPTAAIVRGRCLGGGLEVALACDVVFASADAKLGVPEISLGVFPPAAAALLPLRIGASRASRAVLTGELLPAAWWETAGLVAATAATNDLDAYVHHWFETFMAPRSAVALRHAAVASRAVLRDRALPMLQKLERQYLDELMLSHDAAEGCAAFLEKRAPVWRNG